MRITWTRTPRARRHSTTRSLGASLVLVAMAATACGDGSANAGGSGENVLRVGTAGLPKLLVPAGSGAAIESQMVQHVFDGLVQLDPETRIDVLPALATSWAVSDDGLRYEFELREGVEFQDGTPFDSEAVKLNYERLADPDSQYYWSVGAATAEYAIYGNVERLEVTGSHSVVFHLKEPDPDWLTKMTLPHGDFVSPAVLEEYPPDEVTDHPVGAGPFEVDRRDASAITFKRNPTYWGEKPSLDGFVIRGYEDDAPRLAAIQAGEVDFITSVPRESLGTIDEDEFELISLWSTAWIVRLNIRHEALKDVRVRKALNYAVDRAAIVDGVFTGTAEVSTQAFHPGNPGYNPEQEGYEYDPDKAKELLAEAGYPDGLSIKGLIPTSGIVQAGPVTQAIQADLREVGVDLEYDSLEWTTYLEKVAPGMTDEYALNVTEWGDTTLAWLRQQLGTAGFPPEGANQGYYSNPEADRLMDEADQPGIDPDERVRLFREAQALMVEDAPWVFVVNPVGIGLATVGVDGIRYSSTGFDLSAVTIR